MFRQRRFYFMEFEVNRIPDSKSTDRDRDLRKELLCALERARGCLAIAIAAEYRYTPRYRREYYLDTAELMRYFVAGLKKTNNVEDLRLQTWETALDALRKISRNDGAEYLCKYLREVVTALNGNKG